MEARLPIWAGLNVTAPILAAVFVEMRTPLETVEVGSGGMSGKGGYLKHDSAPLSPVAKGKLPLNTEGNTANPDES